MYFYLPFTGQHRLQIRTQVRKFCSNAFPHISIRFVFRPSLRLAHFFSFKDRIPNGLKSRVVYLFKCWWCNGSYVGQTSRLLHTRIADHLGISVLTGKERVNPSATDILSHHHDTGHPITSNNFTILSHSSSSITHETPHQRELTHSQTQSYSHVSIKLNTFFLILISFTLLRQIYANELCNNILVVALPYYVSFSDDVASQATKR